MFRLLSIFVESARAACPTSDLPGVQEMWDTICDTVPFTNISYGQQGEGAAEFFSQRIVDFLFPLIVGAAVCGIIYAGIKMIKGGEEGFGEAKTIIMYTLAGVVLSILTGSVFVFIGDYLLPLLFQ